MTIWRRDPTIRHYTTDLVSKLYDQGSRQVSVSSLKDFMSKGKKVENALIMHNYDN